jgi:hypothetical protein
MKYEGTWKKHARVKITNNPKQRQLGLHLQVILFYFGKINACPLSRGTVRPEVLMNTGNLQVN